MPTLPAEFTKVILIFESVFSKRVWQHAQVLIAGALLAVGQRTVSTVLRVTGLGQLRQFQQFHRVLNRVLNRTGWSALAASRVLLGALLRAFVPEGPGLVGLDDTITTMHCSTERPPRSVAVPDVSHGESVGGGVRVSFPHRCAAH